MNISKYFDIFERELDLKRSSFIHNTENLIEITMSMLSKISKKITHLDTEGGSLVKQIKYYDDYVYNILTDGPDFFIDGKTIKTKEFYLFKHKNNNTNKDGHLYLNSFSFPNTDMFDNMLNTIFEGVSNNITFAGGSVLSYMIRGYIDKRQDIDVFIINDHEYTMNIIKKNLLNYTEKCLSIGRTCNSFCMIFYNQEEGRKYNINISLKRYTSISRLIHGFDIDTSCVAYYNGTFYGTKRFLFALKTRTNIMNHRCYSPTYFYRIIKYNKKYGFNIYIPYRIYFSADIKKNILIDNNIFINKNLKKKGFPMFILGLIYSPRICNSTIDDGYIRENKNSDFYCDEIFTDNIYKFFSNNKRITGILLKLKEHNKERMEKVLRAVDDFEVYLNKLGIGDKYIPLLDVSKKFEFINDGVGEQGYYTTTFNPINITHDKFYLGY